jgi:hypothetical protein
MKVNGAVASSMEWSVIQLWKGTWRFAGMNVYQKHVKCIYVAGLTLIVSMHTHADL